MKHGFSMQYRKGIVVFLVISLAFITASSGCSKGKRSGKGNSSIPVTGVAINKTSTFLQTGGTEQLGAQVIPENATNKEISWSSSDGDIVTVDSSGIIKGIGAGTAVITVVTDESEKNAQCTVTVTDYAVPVTGLALTAHTASADTGYSIQIQAVITPSNATNQNINWSSSIPDVASVSSTGLVQGIKEGTSVITAKSADGGYSDTCTVTVKNVTVTGVTLNKTETSITIDGNEKLYCTLYPEHATDKRVTWSSGSKSVADVSQEGVVTAFSTGTAVITVTTADQNKTAACTVTVSSKPVPVTNEMSVSLDKDALEIIYADGDDADNVTKNVTLPDKGNNGSVITWSSSNYLRIYSNGTVKRPYCNNSDIDVVLKATIIKGDSTATKEFTVKVLASEECRVTIHYYRSDNNYGDDSYYWGAHLWGGSSESNMHTSYTSWSEPFNFPNDDSFGKYVSIDLTDTINIIGLIIHLGDFKDTDPDRIIDLNADGNEIWIISGDETSYFSEETAKATKN